MVDFVEELKGNVFNFVQQFLFKYCDQGYICILEFEKVGMIKDLGLNNV